MTGTPGKTGKTGSNPPPTDASRRCEQEDMVDFESEQSFPASDPPSWTLGPDKVPGDD
mgnify:CR=1 FL=1